ncbi:MAG TPA: hypothetical protein VKR56_15495 [Candidatus Cybelea sp.]|nr:hypothetical protein [Candidatus Cybelea sp.]
MRPVGLIVIAFVLAVSAPASATGNVRIQQRDGSTQTYTGVTFKIANKTLTIESADKYSKVVLRGADCAHEGDIVRCTGGAFTLFQGGEMHAVKFKSATFYFNLTDQDQTMPLSTMKVAAHSVVFVMQTAKGTYVTGDGKLDQEPTP